MFLRAGKHWFYPAGIAHVRVYRDLDEIPRADVTLLGKESPVSLFRDEAKELLKGLEALNAEAEQLRAESARLRTRWAAELCRPARHEHPGEAGRPSDFHET